MAMEKDRRYALAFAGVAETCCMLGQYDMLPSKDMYSKAREFAEKALSIDNSLSDAHFALGHVSSHEWNFERSEIEFRRSIELNASLSQPHFYLADLLIATERFDEAASEAQTALELDPLSSVTCSYVGANYLCLKQYDEAAKILERALKLDPLNVLALENLGLCHVQKGMFDIGLEEMIRAKEIESPNINPMAECELAYAYSKAGYDDKPREILSLLLNEVKRNPGCATAIAGVYSVLEEKEKAFEWLERAYKSRSGFLIYIEPEFAFDNIRGESEVR